MNILIYQVLAESNCTYGYEIVASHHHHMGIFQSLITLFVSSGVTINVTITYFAIILYHFIIITVIILRL